jgi:hypothetical protein
MPDGEGLAALHAHPGGNVTGNAVFFQQIMAKRLERGRDGLRVRLRQSVDGRRRGTENKVSTKRPYLKRRGRFE